MSEHTPGPWSIDDRDIYAGDVRLAGLRLVGEPVEHDTDPNRDFPETEANARLIAAAPDLLAALESAHERLYEHDLCLCGGDPFETSGGDMLFTKCEAAIAITKARGERVAS